MPKTIAFVSSTNVPRMTGCLARKRNPALNESTLGRSTSPFGRAGAIREISTTENANDATSIRYVAPKPAVAIRMPPIAGPDDRPGVEVDRLERLRRGELLLRDEARHHRAQRRCAERPQRCADESEGVERPHHRLGQKRVGGEQERQRRRAPPRSTAPAAAGRGASAIVPPIAEKSSSGTASQIESRPTWSVDPVRWYSWIGTATNVTMLPR